MKKVLKKLSYEITIIATMAFCYILSRYIFKLPYPQEILDFIPIVIGYVIGRSIVYLFNKNDKKKTECKPFSRGIKAYEKMVEQNLDQSIDLTKYKLTGFEFEAWSIAGNHDHIYGMSLENIKEVKKALFDHHGTRYVVIRILLVYSGIDNLEDRVKRTLFYSNNRNGKCIRILLGKDDSKSLEYCKPQLWDELEEKFKVAN